MLRRKNARILTKDVRRQVVQHLDAEGLFETRNAAEHVAEALGVSRATISNLRQDATATTVPCSTSPPGRSRPTAALPSTCRRATLSA